jgi:hypothetical protein
MWRMMTEAGVVTLAQQDVESGNITSKLVGVPDEDLDVTKIYRNRSDSVPVSTAGSLCVKLFISLLVLAFGSPFVICDLYYAYMDDTCVHNPTKKLDIDMYQYLLISGYYGVSFLGFIVLAIFISKKQDFASKKGNDDNDCIILFAHIFKILMLLFSTAWVIVGAIIFWHEIDNANCSKPVYNYLTASLVLKIASVFFAWRDMSNKK